MTQIRDLEWSTKRGGNLDLPVDDYVKEGLLRHTLPKMREQCAERTYEWPRSG